MPEKSLERLNSRITKLEDELDKYKKEGKALEKKVNRLENDINQLKKRRDHLKSKNYRSYYLNPNNQGEVVNRLADTIDQEGTILELKALNDFIISGYNASEYFYIDKITGKTRQIDIIATKQSSFNICETETKISLNLWIVADCKYKSQVDLLCFDVGITPEEVLQFPVFIASDYRFGLDDDFDQNLLVTSKITQLVIDANTMKGDHLNDGMIYDSSLQVYDCLRSLHHEQAKQYSNHMKLELERGSYLKRAVDIVEGKDFCINTDDIMSRLSIKTAYDLFSGVELVYLDVFVPVIIFDENRGILKAEIDSDFRLNSLADIGIVLYEFSKGYQLDVNDLVRDYIFLVNRNELGKLFSYLELYLSSFEKRFRKLFESHPRTLLGVFSNALRHNKALRNNLWVKIEGIAFGEAV